MKGKSRERRKIAKWFEKISLPCRLPKISLCSSFLVFVCFLFAFIAFFARFSEEKWKSILIKLYQFRFSNLAEFLSLLSTATASWDVRGKEVTKANEKYQISCSVNAYKCSIKIIIGALIRVIKKGVTRDPHRGWEEIVKFTEAAFMRTTPCLSSRNPLTNGSYTSAGESQMPDTIFSRIFHSFRLYKL